jgi:hypothetical protein
MCKHWLGYFCGLVVKGLICRKINLVLMKFVLS